MTSFKESLFGLDTELMRSVVLNAGSGIQSQDDNIVERLIEYPAFSTLFVSLADRVNSNPGLSEEEKRTLLVGAMTCLEVFADYANAEDLQAKVSGKE